jgi:hypothetical protein
MPKTASRAALSIVRAAIATLALTSCAAPVREARLEASRSAPWKAAPAAPREPVRVASLSQSVRDLGIVVTAEPKEPGEVRALQFLTSSLVARGYRIVESGADARLDVKFTRIASFHGVSDAGDIQVSIALNDEEETRVWLIAAVPADDAGASRESADFVERLTASTGLTRLAEEHAASRSKVTKVSHPPSITAPTVMARQSEPELSESALRRCRNARTLGECAKVRSYVEAFPEGEGAAKARMALEIATSRLEKHAQGEEPLPIGEP